MLNILLTAYSELLVISHHCPRTFLCVIEMVFLYHLVFLYHSGGFIPFLVFLPCGYTRVFVPLFMLRHCFQTGVRCILGLGFYIQIFRGIPDTSVYPVLVPYIMSHRDSQLMLKEKMSFSELKEISP